MKTIQICKSTIERYGLGDRVSAECAELSTVPDLVSAADVIVLNNVFDWFMPNDAQANVSFFLCVFPVIRDLSKFLILSWVGMLGETGETQLCKRF